MKRQFYGRAARNPGSGILIVFGIVALCGQLSAAEPVCPPGTLLEPYENICARINDVRDEFIPPAAAAVSRAAASSVAPVEHAILEDAPEPGTLSIGVRFVQGYFSIAESSRLHSQMFVYPDGIGQLPDWLFTPATNRVDQSVEVVGMFRPWNPDTSFFGVYARPCSEAYPCPNGSTVNSWQYGRPYTELACNVSHVVDEHDHSNQVVHYAHHTDKLDDQAPPLWKSAVYLWNYCNDEWDLTWEHQYRFTRNDCGELGCAYWGPAVELFGSELYPEIPEIGYAKSLLIHDGVRSELRPEDGVEYMVPESIPHLVGWETLHLDPNRGFGVGTSANLNDPPEISDQSDLSMPEDTSLLLTTDDVVITDSDVDERFQASFALIVEDGEDHTHVGNLITPDQDYVGTLSVPVRASDGRALSESFSVSIDVTPINDPPVITGQSTVTAIERVPYVVSLDDLEIYDPDDALDDLLLTVGDGPGYSREGNTITPDEGATALTVPVTVDDQMGSDTLAMAVGVVITDSDLDGLDDGSEVAVYGTDPYNEDTDGDTMPDGLEVEEGLNPLDGTDCPDWYCDEGLSVILRVIVEDLDRQ